MDVLEVGNRTARNNRWPKTAMALSEGAKFESEEGFGLVQIVSLALGASSLVPRGSQISLVALNPRQPGGGRIRRRCLF